MSDPMASEGSISDIRRATAHLDSDALSSKMHARKLHALDVAADRESADPSGRASETPSANTESESVNSLTEDDDKLQRMAAACRTLLEVSIFPAQNAQFRASAAELVVWLVDYLTGNERPDTFLLSPLDQWR